MAPKVCRIAGDGIGPEITKATQRVLEAAGAEIDWVPLPAGAAAAEEHGDVLPTRPSTRSKSIGSPSRGH